MNRAQGPAIDDRGDALRVDVGHDVGGLDERALSQRADRAPVAGIFTRIRRSM